VEPIGSEKEVIDFWKGFAKLSDEYKLVDDSEMINGLAKGVLSNQKAHGLKYCPCRLAQGDFIKDLRARVHVTFRFRRRTPSVGSAGAVCL
jgi:ferredoxin-thioredoxin reductase catalytic subunit